MSGSDDQSTAEKGKSSREGEQERQKSREIEKPSLHQLEKMRGDMQSMLKYCSNFSLEDKSQRSL